MVSNQVIQNTLAEIASITKVNAAVYDNGARLIVSKGNMGTVEAEMIMSFLRSGENEMETGEWFLGRISDEGETELVAVVRNNTANAPMAIRLIMVQLDSLVQAYKERIDKDSFIKNLLLDNLLQVDILNRAKKLHIEFRQPRAVFLVETLGQEQATHDTLAEVVNLHAGDNLTGIDEESQVILHRISTDNAAEELKEFAAEIRAALQDAGLSGRIAYGSVMGELKDASRSYKEARLAMDVCRICYEEQDIISYNRLGIGRLIYQLPLNLCHMFINEILDGRTMDEFDEETLITINKFFENNLNVSETSRQLFIHRNTLVYRLDKLQKTTGLDLRVFDDAITFKIALMVIKYIDYMDRIDY